MCDCGNEKDAGEGVKKEQDELEKELNAELGDEVAPKIRREFSTRTVEEEPNFLMHFFSNDRD